MSCGIQMDSLDSSFSVLTSQPPMELRGVSALNTVRQAVITNSLATNRPLSVGPRVGIVHQEGA